MKLHEYQAKELLSGYGITVPKNAGIATTPAEVRAAVEKLGGRGVIKAQVHSGGRGKGGGIKVANSPEEAEQIAEKMLGMLLKTKQVPEGLVVEQVLIEEPITIVQEYYLSIVPDRSSQRNVFILSAEGGMDIEEVAENNPEAIVKLAVDPLQGVHDFQLREAILQAKLDPKVTNKVAAMMRQLLKVFVESDASLAEINPLAVTDDGRVLAADAKWVIDDSALFRQKAFEEIASDSFEDPFEAEAHRKNIAYVRLGGEVGIICNGAGLTMTTMDEVKRAGGNPANFLDVGGGAEADKVTSCLELVLSDPNVKGVLFNIFGGITRGSEVAKGIVEGTKTLSINVPIVVRLAGTEAEEGAKILEEASLISASTMQEAANKIVSLTR